MEQTIHPHPLRGTIRAIPSKSQAHRYLICAAFSQNPTQLVCPETNQDMEATADCLRALGATVTRSPRGYTVCPGPRPSQPVDLYCRESGSTLRFLLPVVGALGLDATFHLEGRLSQRPMSPLWETLEAMGCTLSRPSSHTIRSTGTLRPGAYSIDAGVSSQFVSGLLFALSLLPGESTLTLTGNIESRPYIDMTLRALEGFGQHIPLTQRTFSLRPQAFQSPGVLTVEGDWSNGAFWMAAANLGSDVTILGLDPTSPQGDRAANSLFPRLYEFQTIDASQIPDLVPILAVVAGAKKGAAFVNAGRLRFKETDRLQTTADLIRRLGGDARVEGDCLLVQGTGYVGGTVDATGDHRIAMAAAIAATVCTQDVTILGAESVNKSYPGFWRDYAKLGGR